MPKILVIDDSAFMRHQLRGFLEEAGHEVVEFLPLSALEVLERVREIMPDLILSDYNMPDVDGQSVTRMAKRANPGLPILILTATRDVGREAALAKLGVAGVLHKPISQETLLQAVKKVLG